MPIWGLFGTAKTTAKKAGKDVRRAERKASDIYQSGVDKYDRGVKAHKRGSSEVAERFGRANREAGEYAERAFGFGEDSGSGGGFGDGGSPDVAIDSGDGGGRWENDPSFPFGGGDDGPDRTVLGASDFGGVPDPMGDNDDTDRFW